MTASGSAPTARFNGDPQSAICGGIAPSPAVRIWIWYGALAIDDRERSDRRRAEIGDDSDAALAAEVLDP